MLGLLEFLKGLVNLRTCHPFPTLFSCCFSTCSVIVLWKFRKFRKLLFLETMLPLVIVALGAQWEPVLVNQVLVTVFLF